VSYIRSGRRVLLSVVLAALIGAALFLSACGGERTSGEFRNNPTGGPASTQQAAGF
jgi:hypothetical protein